MINVGIIGITGFAGETLYRALLGHPEANIQMVCARSSQGETISSLYSDIKSDQTIEPIDFEKLDRLDAVFLAVPHGTAKELARNLETVVIDFTGDHRLTHPYGLPEFFEEEIKKADLIANPGCYATSCLLSVFPIKDNIKHVVFNSLSGYSGGGRNNQYETKDNVIPYKLTDHRHNLEMARFLNKSFSFTPHVIDTFRGIITTSRIFLKAPMSHRELLDLYHKTYQGTLTRVQEDAPQLKAAVNTPWCVLGGFEEATPGEVVIISVIDNLLKGAASQAVENMNIRFGFERSLGLTGKEPS